MTATSFFITEIAGSRISVVTLEVSDTFSSSFTFSVRWITMRNKTSSKWTYFRSMNTFSFSIARVISTCITIVTNASSKMALSVRTRSNSTVVWSFTYFLSYTSKTSNISRFEASISIFNTFWDFSNTFSRSRVAFIACSKVRSTFTSNRSSQTSQFSITECFFTFVISSTYYRSFYNTFQREYFTRKMTQSN